MLYDATIIFMYLFIIFLQIQVSPDECVHVRIFEPLPCNNDTNQRVFLHGYLTGKTVGDELDYFDQQQLS